MPRGNRRAEATLGARSDKLDAELRKARGKFRRFGRDSSRDLKKSFGSVKRSMAAIAGFGGVAILGQMARETYNFEKSLFRLQQQGNKNKAWAASMGKAIRSVSNETGAAADEVLAGAEKYVTLTGDADGAAKSLMTFARVSQASGSSMEDIAEVAASLQDSLKIDPGDFEKAFSVLLSQGEKGAVELKATARLVTALASQFQRFGGSKGIEGMAELGAMLQVGKKGFGTEAEAATGLKNAMTALSRGADKFRKGGVRVFDKGPGGVKKFRNLSDIFEDISRSKLAKDPTLLTKAFGSAEAEQLYTAWQSNRDMFDEMKTKMLDSNEVAKQFAEYQDSSFGKMDRAWQRMKNTMAEMITPERIEKFATMMGKLADVVGVLADHATEVAAAWAGMKGIGALGALGGGGGRGGAGGGVAGLLGKVGQVSIVAGAAYIGGKAIADALNQGKKTEEKQSAAQAGFAQMLKMYRHSVATKGASSPEALAMGTAVVKEAQRLGFVDAAGRIGQTPGSFGAGAQAYRENRSGWGKFLDVATGVGGTGVMQGMGDEQAKIAAENREALRAIKAQEAAAATQKVDVRFAVEVDENGLLRVREKETRKGRARGSR